MTRSNCAITVFQKVIGLAGSPTKIAKASDKVRKGAGEKVTLDPTESVKYIMDKLNEKHVI